MATFDQLADMERLIARIARMDQLEHRATENDDTLYGIIEDAKQAMKSQKLRKQKRESSSAG